MGESGFDVLVDTDFEDFFPGFAGGDGSFIAQVASWLNVTVHCPGWKCTVPNGLPFLRAVIDV